VSDEDPDENNMTRSFLLSILIIAVFVSGCTQINTDTNKNPIPPTLAIAFPNGNSSYWINIDPVSHKQVGDRFTIHAETNLPVNETVRFYIHQIYYKPKSMDYIGGSDFDQNSGSTKVNGTTSGNNSIIFNTDLSTFEPDDYLIEIASMNRSVSGFAVFSILETPQTPSRYTVTYSGKR
jgi:hypothetical protein